MAKDWQDPTAWLDDKVKVGKVTLHVEGVGKMPCLKVVDARTDLRCGEESSFRLLVHRRKLTYMGMPVGPTLKRQKLIQWVCPLHGCGIEEVSDEFLREFFAA